jgi:hypothetical protein
MKLRIMIRTGIRDMFLWRAIATVGLAGLFSKIVNAEVKSHRQVIGF